MVKKNSCKKQTENSQIILVFVTQRVRKSNEKYIPSLLACYAALTGR